jgi:hypothetical protein
MCTGGVRVVDGLGQHESPGPASKTGSEDSCGLNRQKHPCEKVQSVSSGVFVSASHAKWTNPMLRIPVAHEAWVSRRGSSAQLRSIGPSGLALPRGRYLVSFLGLLNGDTVHVGSVLVKLSGGSARASAVPVRYQPRRDGTSYMSAPPIHDAGFEVTIEGGTDETARLETGPVDVPDYELYTSPAYPPSRTDGDVSLEALERQCMLLFPTTLIPGAAGIPAMITYPASMARKCLSGVDHSVPVATQIRLLAGSFIRLGARWVDERADDTGPAQLKLMQGDDCDGLSVSARALLQSVAKHCGNTPAGAVLHKSHIFLVAGTALLQGKVQAHMWVAALTPDGVINCECTAESPGEDHFRFAAYAWSQSACYVLVGPDGKIGVEASNLTQGDLTNKLRASSKLRSALSRAFYHVLVDDGGFSDRTTRAA